MTLSCYTVSSKTMLNPSHRVNLPSKTYYKSTVCELNFYSIEYMDKNYAIFSDEPLRSSSLVCSHV